MASSSSARYDVFLCFCRQDVACSGFVNHLSAAFRRKNLLAFEDRGVGDCDFLSEATLAAIEGSRVSVVVISESYTSCRPCLEKLLEILKCRREIDQAVVPVFYRVSPSDVLNQTGKFTAGVTGHGRSELAERLLSWRAALMETAVIPGHNKNDLWDSQLVDVIVRDVSRKLFTTEEKNLIGIDCWLQKIGELGNQSSGFHGVGIWGMGGIGKTTIAEAMFNKLFGKFEDGYFFRNFDERLRKEGLYNLQEQFFAHLLEEKLDTSSLNAESTFVRDRLRSKKVLVVLDDVRNSADVESLVGGFDWFGSGSVIIITSRDKQVLVKCQIHEIYQLEGLNEHDALQLFSWYAIGGDIPTIDLLELSKKVVEYADGNPLALKYFGETQKDRLLKEPGLSFLELKQHSMHQVLDVLKSSYDALDGNEKNIFLDIACFFKGEDVGHLINLLEGCGFFPSIGINILVEKSLITISDRIVKMHYLIQDMGRQVVLHESEEPENLSRLWDASSIIDVLAHDKGSETTEGIFLDASNLSLNISPTAFEKTYNLRLLKVYGSSSEDNGGICLPDGLATLPCELRLLHWENYSLGSLPQDFDPGNLIELNLPQSNILRLWEGTKNLKMLKKIRLSHSQELIEIPGLSEAQNLEHLDLTGCASLQIFPELSPNIIVLYLGGTGIEEIPSSIGNNSRLARLDLENCRKLRNLPTTLCKLKSLKWLNLSGCWKLGGFPEISETMGSLCSLDLSETAIMDLPSSISNLIALEKVSLRDCRYCLKLLDNLSKLKTLKWVNFDEKFYSPPATCLGGYPQFPAHASLLYLVSTPYFLAGQNGHVEIPKDFFHRDTLELSDLDGNEYKQLLFSISQLLERQSLYSGEAPEEELSPDLLPDTLNQWTDPFEFERIRKTHIFSSSQNLIISWRRRLPNYLSKLGATRDSLCS